MYISTEEEVEIEGSKGTANFVFKWPDTKKHVRHPAFPSVSDPFGSSAKPHAALAMPSVQATINIQEIKKLTRPYTGRAPSHHLASDLDSLSLPAAAL